MRGYDAWKTAVPYGDEPDVEWDEAFLESAPIPVYRLRRGYWAVMGHACECGKFLSNTPDGAWFDGENFVFEFRCSSCGTTNKIEHCIVDFE